MNLLNATISTRNVTITRDIAYGPDPRQRLDIYQPKPGPGPSPAVVFFYGGSWNTGARKDYLFVAATLARHGIAVFVPDYRLYPAVTYPSFLADCALATVWAQTHAAQYAASDKNVFLMGHSAGAYNAAMLALDPKYLAAARGSRASLRGMIGLAGPYDFLPLVDPEVIAVFNGKPTDPEPQPISHVDGHNPPMLLLAGSADTTVYPKNTVNLAAAIAARGGPVEQKIYPSVAHIGIVISLAPLFRGKDTALADTLDFIARHRTTP